MAARMGFDGKWAIHPSQIDIINAVFTPTSEEIASAKHIMRRGTRRLIRKAAVGAIVIDDQDDRCGRSARCSGKSSAIAQKAGLA